jgi:peptidoglycan/xylan/chitin deacetylase (PgdA/CDA1 family)
MKKNFYKKVVSIFAAVSLLSSMAVMPVFAKNTSSFSEDFESYTVGEFIAPNDEEGKWHQTQAEAFYAAEDPKDPSNIVGLAKSQNKEQYITNRTQVVNINKPTIISGSAFLKHDNLKIFTTNFNMDHFLYFYSIGNSSHSQNILVNWIDSAKWVPDEWIDYTITIVPNTADLAHSTLNVFLKSENGLTDLDGNPIKSLFVTGDCDLNPKSGSNSSDMIRFDTYQTASDNYVYMDKIDVFQSDGFNVTIPQNTNVSGNVTVNFENPVKMSQLTSDNVKITSANGDDVVIESIEANDVWFADESETWVKSINITPQENFAADTVYKVILVPDVLDYAGTSAANSANFSTGADVPDNDVNVSSVTIEPGSLTIPADLDEKGLDCVLKTTVFPSDATNQALSWSSSDDGVAKVEDGNIIPVSAGTAVITAVSTDGTNKKAECKVTVTAARDEDQKLNLTTDERPDINVKEALEYPTDEETAKVALWKNNARGAFSMTSDDPSIHTNCFDAWINAKKDFGQNVTFFTWTNNVNINDSNFTKLKNAGMDIQSHSKTHYSAADQMNLTTAQVLNEYASPVEEIGAVALAYPEGLRTELPYDSKAYASNYYIAARGVTGQINMPNKTGLVGEQQTTDYMHISSQSVNVNSPLSIDTPYQNNWHLEGLVKSLCNDGSAEWSKYTYKNQANLGGWAVMHTHGIDETTTSNPSHPGEEFTGEQLIREVMGFVQDTNGLVWGDTFTNVAKYAQERDSSTLTVTSKSDSKITYTLTDKMDDTIFNYPVTVMVKIPSAWTGIRAIQNGEKIDATINEDGYAFIETVPDKGEVTLTVSNSELPDDLIEANIVKAWPDGKLKAVTANFDDGQADYTHEKWLTDLLRTNGIKSTFSIPSGHLMDTHAGDIENYKAMYEGFEVASHTKYHSAFNDNAPYVFEEGLKYDIETLKAITDEPIQGMAYPNGGAAQGLQKQILKENGILYGRTTYSSRGFGLPDDLYNWNPTCFLKNIDDVISDAKTFVSLNPSEMSLFYVWGHSYQLDDSNMAKTQTAIETLGGHDDIYYATNIEIAKYLIALDELVIANNVDNVVSIYNPSDMTVWVKAEGTVIEVPAGATKYVTVEGSSGSSVFTDPCEADPNGDDKKFIRYENGIGTGTIDGDTGYSRYAMQDGMVHSLVYKADEDSTGYTGLKILSYSRSTGDKNRFSPIKVYASLDDITYSEISLNYNQIGDINSWWLYRVDYENVNPLPEGTKYVKISFPEDYIVNASDNTNEVLIGNVELYQGAKKIVTVYDNLPVSEASLSASMPANNSVDVDLDTDVKLVFDKEMDISSVQAGISVDNGADYSVIPSDDARSFTVVFNKQLNADTVYTISINGVTDKEGKAVLDRTVSFTTLDPLNGKISDTANDYRYVYEKGGSQDVFTGVDGAYNVAFARTAADTTGSTSYVVYRAPIGEFTSMDLQLYRNEGACVNPFTIYTSSDNESYIKLMDDTEGEKSSMIDKGYYPIKLLADTLPAGTKYIKIEFPQYSDSDSPTAYHMAQISNVNLTYSAEDTSKAFENVEMMNIDENGKILAKTSSVGENTNGRITLVTEIRNYKPEMSNKEANVIFTVTDADGKLIKMDIQSVNMPAYGEAVYADTNIVIEDAADMSGYNVNCYLWNSMSEIIPLGSKCIID